MVEIIGPREEELDFELSKNAGLEPETTEVSAVVPSAIDIVNTNDVNDTQVYEGRRCHTTGSESHNQQH